LADRPQDQPDGDTPQQSPFMAALTTLPWWVWAIGGAVIVAAAASGGGGSKSKGGGGTPPATGGVGASW
jgi:hypothetical protein